MERKQYHHGNLKVALVAAGLEILETDGLQALSLRAIAARVGVSHTAPKNHFHSLRGLLTAIGAEGFRRHAAAMRAGVEVKDFCAGDPRTGALQCALDGYVNFALDNPALFELMFSPAHCDHGDPELAAAADASYAILAHVADGLDWPGAEGADRQRRTETMLWSFVHGYAVLAQQGQLDVPPKSRFRHSPKRVIPNFRYLDPRPDP